jgi:hypothetical protein
LGPRWAVFVQNSATFLQKLDHSIFLKRKTQFLRRKSAENAEIIDHNNDPGFSGRTIFKIKTLAIFYKPASISFNNNDVRVR